MRVFTCVFQLSADVESALLSYTYFANVFVLMFGLNISMIMMVCNLFMKRVMTILRIVIMMDDRGI